MENVHLNLGKIKEESEYRNKTDLNLPGKLQKCEAISFSLFMISTPCLFKHHLSD